MNIGSEKFGALQEILPINFYEAKIWISDTFLRKWGDIKVNLTQWYWSKECQDFSEKTTMLEKRKVWKKKSRLVGDESDYFFSWLFNSTFWKGLDAPILSFTRQSEGWGAREVMLLNDDDNNDDDDHDN